MAAQPVNGGRPLRVLVTGGGGGIGLAVAKAFAANGARVHVCDVDELRLGAVVAAGGSLSGGVADVADHASVYKLFDTVRETLGGLDVLVNNAAISGPFGPVEENDPALWAKTISINLVGQFNCAREAVPLLRGAGGGNVESMRRH